MLRVALKSVLARKRRLFTTGFAIVLSVAFISGTLVITALMNSTLDSLIGSSYDGIDAIVRSAEAQESDFGPPIRPTIPDSTLGLVSAAKGVRAAAGLVQGLPTIIDKNGDRIQDLAGPPTLAFNWIDDPELQGGRLAEGGRPPVTPEEVVIDVRTAEEYDFSIGDQVQAGFPVGLRTFTIVGIGGIPVDGQENLVAGPRVLLLELTTAQQLLGKDGFDYIALSAADGVSQVDLQRTLTTILPPDQETLTGEEFVAESEETISRLISLFTQPILAFGFVAVFVGSFVIYNTFSIVVAQRTRELALLRAVGSGRGQILGSVMVEAVVVGLVASTVGIAGGWALSYGLKVALSSSFSLPPGLPPLTPQAILVGLGIGIGSTLISAFVPSIRATFIPPIAALGETAIDRTALSVRRKVIGSVLLLAGIAIIALVSADTLNWGLSGRGFGAALLFLGITTLGPVFAGPMARTLGAPLPRFRGVSGRIGKENAGRNPKRTAITAVALSIGVCLVVVVAIFAASIRATVQDQLGNQLADVDLVVDSGTGFAGLGPEPREFLESRPEVALVNPIRFNQGTLLDTRGAKEDQAEKGESENGIPVGDSEFLIGVDRTAIFEIANIEDLTPPIAEIPDDEVMVLAQEAEENGWKPGDTIRVWFAKTGEQRWRIAATFGSRIGNGAEYITNNETQAKNALPEFDVDSTIWVKLQDGLDPETVLADLKPELKKIAPTAGFNTIGDYVGERLAILDSVVNLIYVLLGLSIVIALVGVGNTISLSIHERTRELGLLRAVGMTRSQLAESVIWESVIIALAGTVVGLVIGVVLGTTFVDGIDQQGIEPVVSVVTVAIIGIIGAVAGVFLAIRPSRRATRVDVLAAISSV